MVISPSQIDLWRGAPTETQNLEFKEAKENFDWGKLCSYCVAIANEGGGNLILGIGDKIPRAIVGTNAFLNVVETADRLFHKIGFRVDVEDVHHPDGRVVVFQIPSRPKGTAYDLEGKYLMRAGASLVPMSEDRLRAIFAEGKPDWLEEAALGGLSDAQVVDLLDTQAFFDLMGVAYPTNRTAVLERLAAERLIDERNGSFSIRRLGALLIAKKLSSFPDVARKAARVIVYSGKNKLQTRIDQSGTMGYAAGFKGLVEFVVSQLPQNEVIENALREKVNLVPDDVARELIANALVHQDFSISGAGPMIEIYENRMEVSNPGEPIVPPERFIDGYQSRNERLADLMRRMKICEEKSSGIDRVVHAAEVYQLPAPHFASLNGRTVASVFGPRDFEDMDRNDRVRACYQHCALKWVMAEAMTNQSLRQRFGLSEAKAATASQIIAATMEAGLIKADSSIGGSRKYARYLPFWA
ncbi:MAG TPA: ATP-binding protein [Rhizomicrobium sp.]|nr:ATP-binding protein [Rhizomicrobium sp.]